VINARLALPLLLSLVVAGCSREGELTTEGVRVIRTTCPAVAVPISTGDVTFFDPPASRDANAIDVVATMTNVRGTCTDVGENVAVNASFEVLASRRNASGARDVTLPYFATVVQGGTSIVAKSVGHVTVHFADGQDRASASGTATGQVLRSAATIPADIEKQITRRRKAGDANAALDPMADPKVKAAVTRATFEMLVGFQLTPDQLAYNATR